MAMTIEQQRALAVAQARRRRAEAEQVQSQQPQAPVAASPAEQPSMLTAAGMGGLSGLTFGFDDEITAGAKTGLGFVGDYDAELESQRDWRAGLREAHPGVSMIGEVGGALATAPFTGPFNVVRGAGLGARMANQAITGAGYGAAYGTGTAEGGLAERVKGAGAGALMGGAVGGAVPAITQGAGRLAAPLRGVLNPEKEAARRVNTGFARDGVPGEQPLQTAAQRLQRAQANDIPLIAADVGDETTRALARSSANTSPEARTALDAVTDARFEGQTERVGSTLRRINGTGGDTGARLDQLRTAARGANKPAYQRAYAEGSRGLWSENLERLASSPAVVKAMRDVATGRGKDRAVAEGFGGFNSAVQVTDDGQILFQRGQGGVPAYPDLQYWDYVQRELRDMAQKAYRSGANDEGSTLTQLHRAMKAELDEMVPSFAEARAGAAKAFGAEDALDAGGIAARDRRMTNNDLARNIGKMSEPERKLFQEGYANELIESVGRMGDRRNVVGSPAFASKQMRDRHALVLGPSKAKEIETLTQLENIMNKTKAAVQGNSTTARQLAELGLAGGAGYAWSGGDITDMRTFLPMVLMLGARRAGVRINDKVSREVGELLATGEPEKLSRAAEILNKNQTLRLALNKADEYLTKGAAVGATSAVTERRPLEVTIGRPAHWPPQ